jgi:hypothetical protein
MKIKFESPLSFTLDIIENDERTPSICVDVKITVMQFQNIEASPQKCLR